MKRILNLDLTVGIGEGSMLVDGREIYSERDLKLVFSKIHRAFDMREVVVTGIGIVSSLGNNIQEVTKSIRNLESVLSKNEVNAKFGLRSHVSGSKNLDLGTNR